jgi:carbon-monoxide dehydrogenase large subunit
MAAGRHSSAGAGPATNGGPGAAASGNGAGASLPAVQPSRYVGQRLRRKEDARLVTGRGRYVGDIVFPGMRHVAILRSQMAHATIASIDVAEARALPGVDLVVTAAEIAGKVGPYMPGPQAEVSELMQQRVGPTVRTLPMPVLAEGAVHWVGQPIAAVVAESRAVAEDALELIQVDYEALPVMVDPEKAIEPGAAQLHAAIAGNVAAEFVVEAGDADAAMASAAHVFRGRFSVGRQAGNPMETRGVVASFDGGTGDLAVWTTNARPHLVRGFIGKMLNVVLERVRVVSPDMGGSFGTGIFAEDVLIPFLAMELRRPMKWIEDRGENLTQARHSRDQIHFVEVCYEDDGRIVALKDRFLVDSGAWNHYAITVPYNAAAHVRNQFRIPALRVEGLSVLTNKAPVAPIRGAGRPEITFMLDRALDVVAQETGLDPVECRRRNLITPDEMPFDAGMPYRDGVDIVYDRGDFPAQLDQALQMFGYDAFRREQEQARREGRRIGVGVSGYMEGSGFGPYEGAIVRVDSTGHVSVYTGANPHGQGLETTLAQVCADQLGVRPEDVTVRSGDTGLIPYGIGTFASRSAVTAGTAVGTAAGIVREKVLALASELLEAAPGDLDLQDGVVTVSGAPSRRLTLREVAMAAAPGASNRPAGMAPVLEAEYYYEPPTVTWSSGTHVAAVEVDEETGFIRVLRYITVDDCGRMLNPTVVEGQIHGGVAFGLGNTLWEEVVYDEDGQVQTGTYMDYLLPTATDVPPIEVGHQEFLSEVNQFGIKGCGEGGAVGPLAAVTNAVVDALRPLKIRIDRVPLHPAQLLDLIEEAKAVAS